MHQTIFQMNPGNTFLSYVPCNQPVAGFSKTDPCRFLSTGMLVNTIIFIELNFRSARNVHGHLRQQPQQVLSALSFPFNWHSDSYKISDFGIFSFLFRTTYLPIGCDQLFYG